MIDYRERNALFLLYYYLYFPRGCQEVYTSTWISLESYGMNLLNLLQTLSASLPAGGSWCLGTDTHTLQFWHPHPHILRTCVFSNQVQQILKLVICKFAVNSCVCIYWAGITLTSSIWLLFPWEMTRCVTLEFSLPWTLFPYSLWWKIIPPWRATVKQHCATLPMLLNI